MLLRHGIKSAGKFKENSLTNQAARPEPFSRAASSFLLLFALTCPEKIGKQKVNRV
jgi:hypothetical protein